MSFIRRISVGVFLFLGVTFLSNVCVGEASSPSLSLENEFIKIIVNQGPEDLGRFAIETTGGDPKNKLDDEQSLIYGRPVPWTSYTTVRIDGKDFIFGGLSKKTSLRSGQSFLFGTVVSQAIRDSGIVTVCRFDDIRVTQTLSFVRNPSTKVLDTALVSYSVFNEGTRPHDVGIRVMMDTKLGSNDGAPFRMGTHSIESERAFKKDELSEFWQTFDRLDSPSVIAQGTLVSSEHGVTSPDRVHLANWGTLSDIPWDVAYEKDRSFVRAGELDKDTALGLYWEPKSVLPGHSFSASSLYGLGGLTLSPGALSLGLSAPADVFASAKNVILLMAYVSNTGGYDSQHTQVKFLLPNGFDPLDGKSTIDIGLLKAGETRQIPMRVRLDGPEIGMQSLRIDVSSSTLASNSLSRLIDVLSPPRLISELRLPAAKVVSTNRDVRVDVSVYNPTAHPISDVSISLTPEFPLVLADFEPTAKSLHMLRPYQTVRMNWVLKLNDASKQSLLVRAIVDSSATRPETLTKTLQTVVAPSQFVLTQSGAPVKVSDFFYVNLLFDQAPALDGESVELSYDPSLISFLRVTPGARFVDSAMTHHFKSIQIPGSVVMNDIRSSGSYPVLDICKFQFVAKKSGTAVFQLLKNGVPVSRLSIPIQTKGVSNDQ